MKTSHILLFVWLMCLPLQLFAQISEQSFVNHRPLRTADEVARIADCWWKNRTTAKQNMQTVRHTETFSRAHLFSRGPEFLLVSASTAEPEILGYGTLGSTAAPMPAALQMMLGTQPLRHTTDISPAYPLDGTTWKPVSPLLTTVRHQKDPYNRLCPYYRHSDGTLHSSPCVVGCVATAMEQILTYYRRTYTLRDTLKGWKTDHYLIPDVAPGLSVDTRQILDNYDIQPATEAQIDAVARLSYWLGVSCHMDWSVDASGAQSRRLVEPLRRVFGFPYVHYLDAQKYRPVDYWNFLAAEIMAGRPVYYAGSLMRTGGHAFVLDGLDEQGFFHVNWGEGGSHDGYFRLDVLAQPVPADTRGDYVDTGFFCHHEAIVCSPDAQPQVQLPDSLQLTGLEIHIDSLFVTQTPLSGCHTPVTLVLHNTTDSMLTTSFYLIQNLPTDTALIDQAELLAYTGRTFQPGQRDTLMVNLKFTKPDSVWLSVTADAEHLLCTLPLYVATGGTDLIEAEVPEISFSSNTEVCIRQRYRNPSATERAAQNFVYDLLDTATGIDGQIDHFIYLPPAGETTDSVKFTSLVPGRTYTLRVRRRWPMVQTLTFTVPTEVGIESPQQFVEPQSVEWYGIDGKRIALPQQRGVYIRKCGSKVLKVIR